MMTHKQQISFSIFQNLSQDASEFAVHVKDEETLFPFLAVFLFFNHKVMEYIFCNAFWVIFDIQDVLVIRYDFL